MCDACVMNAVRDRMLSRRSLFRGGLAAGAVGLTAATGHVAMAQAASETFDLTHAYGPDFPTFFGGSQFSKEALYSFGKDGFNLFELTVNEHTGTHVDAPFHFSADGKSVDQIDVGDLIVPLCVVDIREKAASDPDAQVTPDDLSAWMAANGDIPARACVA